MSAPAVVGVAVVAVVRLAVVVRVEEGRLLSRVVACVQHPSMLGVDRVELWSASCDRYECVECEVEPDDVRGERDGGEVIVLQ